MWRAYGGPVAGVAFIFNTGFLDIDSYVLAAWSSPALYGDSAFDTQFLCTVERIEQYPDVLRVIDPDVLKHILFTMFRFSLLSAKHICFREEREWRIIHGPREFPSAWLQPTFQTVRGTPEVVYHLPLENHEGMGLPQIDLKQLLNRIIIGPCQTPYQVASTFADMLASIGFQNPSDYLRISEIPLRQQG